MLYASDINNMFVIVVSNMFVTRLPLFKLKAVYLYEIEHAI